MKILVVGSGGREHAIVWKLSQSSQAKEIFCCPGNAGLARLAQCRPVSAGDISGLVNAAKELSPDLVVIGPEAPLAGGLADELTALGLLVFGPKAYAAKLESSKIFAKTFMQRHGIPTADFETFTDVRQAGDFIQAKFGRGDDSWRVIKADGLAAGKGVKVCSDQIEAEKAVEESLEKKIFGQAGEQIIIEKKLEGEELTVMGLCDGKNLAMLPFSQDYKRLYDNDLGPNTGGMGVYSPISFIAKRDLEKIEEIGGRFLAGLEKERIDFRGVIYFGLILTADGPKALEFNVRFGDPETQVVLTLLDTDLALLLESVARGELSETRVPVKQKAACCVVLASKGYPDKPETGYPISGLDEADNLPDTVVFHAGTQEAKHARPVRLEQSNGARPLGKESLQENGGKRGTPSPQPSPLKGEGDKGYVTSGGRVLGVTVWRDNLNAAVDAAYAAVSRINFTGMHYRRDIGHRKTQQRDG